MENWYSSSYFSVTSVWVSTSAQRLMAFNWKTETLATSRAAPEDCWMLCVPGGICRGGYRVCRSPSAELKVTFRLLLSPILPIKLCNRWKASGNGQAHLCRPSIGTTPELTSHFRTVRNWYSFTGISKFSYRTHLNLHLLIITHLGITASTWKENNHFVVILSPEWRHWVSICTMWPWHLHWLWAQNLHIR